MKKRILVTGGAGMIGSNVVKALVRDGHSVQVIDNLWRGKLEYLYDENDSPVIDTVKDMYKLDLAVNVNLQSVLKGVDIVIHLADIVAGINYVFSNQSAIFRQNILINSNIINEVRKSDVEGFLYIGTACSFPETLQNSHDTPPLKEDELYPAQPESAYGWSKLMGQYETELLGIESGIKTCTLMLHNVYGSPCDYSFERSQVIPSLIRKAINYPHEPFIVWGSGSQARAFIHVDDVVSGIISALNKGWGHGHIQLGPSNATSIKELAETIVEISGKDINIEYDHTKPEGDISRSANFTKASEILSWRPTVKLYDGLREQYDWILGDIHK